MTMRVKVVAGTGRDTEFQIALGSTVTFGRMAPANVRILGSARLPLLHVSGPRGPVLSESPFLWGRSPPRLHPPGTHADS